MQDRGALAANGPKRLDVTDVTVVEVVSFWLSINEMADVQGYRGRRRQVQWQILVTKEAELQPTARRYS